MKGQVVVVNEQAQSKVMPVITFGNGERFAYAAVQPPVQGVVPTFDVADFSLALATRAVRALGKNSSQANTKPL